MALPVLPWNGRSIYRKVPEFKHYLLQLATLPDLLCLQETHLNFKYQPHLPSTLYYSKIGPHTWERAGDFAFVSKTP